MYKDVIDIKQIKSIELSFENCEAVRFDVECIDSLLLDSISKSIISNGFNGVHEYSYVESVAIKLLVDTNVNKHFTLTFDDNRKPFERITKHNDITSINVIYSNDEEKCLYVKWDEQSEYVNGYQKTMIDEATGDLYIVISKDKTIEDYFKNDLSIKE